MQEMDIVNLEERARTAIGLGERHFREFKTALHGPPNAKTPRPVKSIRRDIGEALVAFANADGGELLVGVEDDGSITGIDTLSASLHYSVRRDKAPGEQPKLSVLGRLIGNAVPVRIGEVVAESLLYPTVVFRNDRHFDSSGGRRELPNRGAINRWL